jgi:hypothetical protein
MDCSPLGLGLNDLRDRANTQRVSMSRRADVPGLQCDNPPSQFLETQSHAREKGR